MYKLRPERTDFTSNLAHGLAFGISKFYIAPYGKIKHKLVNLSSNCDEGWSGGAMVLGIIPVLGSPTNLDRARAYCAYSRCGWGLLGHFFSHLSFLSSFALSLGGGLILTEILSQRAVKPKTTNQPANCDVKSGLKHELEISDLKVKETLKLKRP